MQLNFLTRQRIIFVGLIVIALLLTRIRHRIRYVLIIPVGIAAIFTLLTIIFPLYPQGPDSTTFYKEQASTLYVSPSTGGTSSKVTIQSKGTLKSIDSNIFSTFNLQPSTDTVITFIAADQNDSTSVSILLPEGSIIVIAPQSKISFFSQYPKITIEVKQGQATYSPSNTYSPWNVSLSGVNKENIGETKIQTDFEFRKSKAMSSQSVGIFLQNAYLKAINKGILQILARVRPDPFLDNLYNFATFEKYISTEIRRNTDTTPDENISQDMVNQAGRGLEETQVYQRWKKLFK